MKSKNKFIVLMMSCIFALSVTACEEGNNSSTIEVNKKPDSAVTTSQDSNNDTDTSALAGNNTPVITQPPLADEDGNYVTEVIVTSDGKTVTDAQGVAQTEYVIIDDRNNIVTDTAGEAVKPSAPVVPSENITGTTTKDTALWIGGIVTDENGKQSMKGFDGDGQIMQITFKVKENCQDGNYKIAFNPSTCSFSDNDSNNLVPVYRGGTITVGSAQAPEAPATSSGTEIYLSSSSAQPGETVTLYTGINNNALGVLGFVLSFSYNSDALELVSIQKTGLIADFGDFATSL